jgi:hypothetical protein
MFLLLYLPVHLYFFILIFYRTHSFICVILRVDECEKFRNIEVTLAER